MRLISLLIGLLGCLLLPALAVGGQRNISGSATLDLGDYTAESGGATLTEGSFFTQQYSLMWTKKGELRGGRAGRWNLKLGGEWNSLDSEVNGSEFNVDTSKLLYSGKLVLAPGGLPFRLTAFSKDLKRTTFLRDSRIQGGLVSPGIVDDLNNGTHRQTGARLEVGIRNGSYLGLYRETLSHLPRLLVDYSEDYVEDLHSAAPVHYRMRNLAFVSLNKKDNWFHYKFTDFTDYLDPTGGVAEKTVLLGTVDHRDRRRWINLTNWIRVSADGHMTTTEEESFGSEKDRLFALNMFGVAERSKFKGSVFGTFTRDRDHSGLLQKDLEIPVNLHGQPNPDTSWRVQIVSDQSQTDALTFNRELTSFYLSAQAETFLQQRYILEPELGFEVTNDQNGDGFAAKAGIEVRSNRRFAPKYDLFGSYRLTYLETTDGTFEDQYHEHRLKGRVERRRSSFRTGFEEDVTIGQGTVPEAVLIRRISGSSPPLDGNTHADVDFLGAETKWFAEFSRRRFTNRIDVLHVFNDTPSGSNSGFELQYRLGYDGRQVHVDWQNSWLEGEDSTGSDAAPSDSRTLSSRLRIDVNLSRALSGKIQTDFEDRVSNGIGSQLWTVEQEASYRIFTRGHTPRTLAVFGQELDYESTDSFAGRQWNGGLTLSGEYFPLRVLRLRAEATRGMRKQGIWEADEFTYAASANLNFQKLKVGVTYSLGSSEPSGPGSEVEERRWNVTINKTF